MPCRTIHLPGGVAVITEPATPRPQEPARQEDPRLTMGLTFDIFEVLEKHGYRQTSDHPSLARALVHILRLTEAFEGRDGGR